MHPVQHHRFLLLFLALLLSTAAGCKRPEIVSRPRTHDIVVDGNDSDWGTGINYYNENTRTTLTFYHDANHLYMKMSVHEPSIMTRILSRGLTTSFDPSGGTGTDLELHFPVAGQAGDGDDGHDPRPGESPAGVNGEQPGPGSDAPPSSPPGFSRSVSAGEIDRRLADMVERADDRLVFTGSGGNVRIDGPPSETADKGVEVDIGTTRGRLVYECKLSRRLLHITGTGELRLGIGFETAEADALPGEPIGPMGNVDTTNRPPGRGDHDGRDDMPGERRRTDDYGVPRRDGDRRESGDVPVGFDFGVIVLLGGAQE